MKFLLFGTGDYYERFKKWFNQKDVLALLDNSFQKQNTLIDGIRVLSPEEGIKLEYDAIVILSFYVKTMKRQLLELGVSSNVIYHFYDLHQLIYSPEIRKPIQYYGKAERIVNSIVLQQQSILLLSQDLALGGTAIALFHVAEVLKEKGYQIVFAAMLDGPLKEKLLVMDIPVIIDPNLQIQTMKDVDWIKKFKLIFCNAINFYVFLSERNTDMPFIWWLHDSAFFYDGVNKTVLKNMDRTNLEVYSVGFVPKTAIQEFVPDLNIRELLYGVSDAVCGNIPMHKRHARICFATIGYIEQRKGQDILVKAINLLPVEIRNKAVFYFVGQNSSVLAQQLQKKIKDIPEIIMTGTVGRDEIYRILEDADAMVCPSREDPMPTVAAEAMMHSVPCVVSDATGTAAYIRDGVDGLVFRSEDEMELASKLRWCIENYDKLYQMGLNARKIYENYFSMKVFENNLLELIQEKR
ncbi:MAG: glycosyltransferase family 4 protein [Lachnospiraceae bacterium]|nr:glycosyltransferase family 4 protein [Lachnospiraceae bacterium]